MNKLFILISTVLLALACNQSETEQTQYSPSAEDTTKRLNIQPTDFVEIDTSGIALFPLSMTETVYGKKRSYKDMPQNDNWNILFYNSNSGENYLLTEQKILIQAYFVGNENSYTIEAPKKLNYIFYTARTDDYNNDKLINETDPLYLFMTDRSGRNFKQISPAGYHLSNWQYFNKSNKVILTGILDKNLDSVFHVDEEQLIFETSLAPDGKPVQVFSKPFLDSLKLNFGKYWHRIKS